MFLCGEKKVIQTENNPPDDDVDDTFCNAPKNAYKITVRGLDRCCSHMPHLS